MSSNDIVDDKSLAIRLVMSNKRTMKSISKEKSYPWFEIA